MLLDATPEGVLEFGRVRADGLQVDRFCLPVVRSLQPPSRKAVSLGR